MIALIILPFYIAFYIWVLVWFLRWLGAINDIFKNRYIKATIGVIFVMVILIYIPGFFLPHGPLKRFCMIIGNDLLGFTIYLLMVFMAAMIVRFILIKSKKLNQKIVRSKKLFVSAYTAGIMALAVLTTFGIVHAGDIQTTKYEVNIDKDGGELDSLKAVLIADLHMGYNIGVDHITQMVEKVNACEPDIVLIGGDIFDNDYDTLEDPDALCQLLASMESKYGTYAVMGNHDIDETIVAGFTFGGRDSSKEADSRMYEFLENAGINVLSDRGILIDDSVYIFGRPDEERPGKGIEERKTPEEVIENVEEYADTSMPIIVLEHEPKETHELAAVGVDAQLCGHTHDGQFFPCNLSSRLVWENSAGYKVFEENGHDIHSIVTSGVGLYGPNMRVGTDAEICEITFNFN